MMKARFPLLFLAILALLAGMWAGLLRIGWAWPPLRVTLPALHGPLMISGFLGTLICLERAVALRRRWAFAPALLSGLGGLLLWLGLSGQGGILLITLGSLGLALLFGWILWGHRTLHTAVMTLGAFLWLLGNMLWLLGRPIHLVVWWWAGFLILTIAGERLELSRVLRLSRQVKGLFGAATAVFLGGLLLTLVDYGWGVRVTGLGMLFLAFWLLRYDLARRNLRKPAITGFIATCLFSGYIWLGVGGVLALWIGPVSAGLRYDAILHAIFLGFVFGMIFGHAPIIFPAVLQRPIQYHPIFYLPLALLQVSLLLRLMGDLFVWPVVRQWGGLLNAIVLLLFLGITAVAIFRQR
ncbi:MAG: hypothetical protein KBE23_11585 [Chloroflexi bacterium]|nr:hypothetical protein [Chloroflexota bacterium]MBP7043376.1 hypothetical protein [Chloroflexota bacterium]